MRPSHFLLPAALLVSLGACASAQKAGTPHPDLAARARIAQADPLSQMTFWAREAGRFPNDPLVAANFVEALRKGKQPQRAAQLGAEALSRMSDSPELRRAYAYALLSLGRGAESLLILTDLANGDPENWELRQALGVAFDQSGRPEEARKAYQAALALSPENVGVMTNLGVSHLLSGELATAETVLRQAVELPGATAETRQNLALAIGLQGRFDEAEAIQRVDLPPEQVMANLNYMRRMLSDSRRWEDLGSN